MLKKIKSSKTDQNFHFNNISDCFIRIDYFDETGYKKKKYDVPLKYILNSKYEYPLNYPK